MTESTTPTPAAVARDAIKQVLAQHALTDLAVQIHLSVIADDILTALAADGYTIAGPGQVAVDASALRQADSWGVFVTIWNDADTDAAHKIAAALAGADAKGAS